ncbi:MAG: hypothetical protein JST90_07550 [Bacteroidetes bacterium]|nr:hypothetical protein [Bacteroidota bacterium]
MSEYRLNKVAIRLNNSTVDIWVSKNCIEGFAKRNSKVFADIKLPIELNGTDLIYSAFFPHSDAVKISINLDEHRYFLKPYVDSIFGEHFSRLGFSVRRDFIQATQVWKLSSDIKSSFFERFTLRVLNGDSSRLELLISYAGKADISLKPLSQLPTGIKYEKYVFEKRLYDKRDSLSKEDPSRIFPILNYSSKRLLEIPIKGTASENAYLKYYKAISVFYENFLKGQVIMDNIAFISQNFERIESSKIFKTRNVSNDLRFHNNTDYSVYKGLKSYGPYMAPKTDDLRFIFIFKHSQKDAANKLYFIFKNGLDNNFPGLRDYVKVNFQLANDNKIELDTNSIEELEEKLGGYKFEPGLRYFAIYLTDHNKFEESDEDEKEYYDVKYALLKRGILSQFIYHRNIESSNFKFHLPNISVAILAKIGGIPWKLDTFSSSNMIIGFGVKRLANNTFLGNTICFKGDGEFYNFETYQRADINTIGAALKESINRIVQHDKNRPDKLIIHYYKTLNSKEAQQIEFALRDFNLNIPYVVVTINDTRSKDYLFFDVSYDKLMPTSGTIVEIKPNREFLLANNSRHSQSQLYSITKFPFPLRVKINKSSNTIYDVFDVKELLDQVYSFSRIYWKSINQVSLPVTIAYSKIVADLAAHFPNHELPNEKIAHSNLWFL